MMQIFSSFTLVNLAFTAVASANAGRYGERQAGCKRDNVVRALSAQSDEATSLCYSLIFFRPTTTVTVPAAGVTPSPVYVYQIAFSLQFLDSHHGSV